MKWDNVRTLTTSWNNEYFGLYNKKYTRFLKIVYFLYFMIKYYLFNFVIIIYENGLLKRLNKNK